MGTNMNDNNKLLNDISFQYMATHNSCDPHILALACPLALHVYIFIEPSILVPLPARLQRVIALKLVYDFNILLLNNNKKIAIWIKLQKWQQRARNQEQDPECVRCDDAWHCWNIAQYIVIIITIINYVFFFSARQQFPTSVHMRLFLLLLFYLLLSFNACACSFVCFS